jgi:hypothetical protein
MFQRRQWTGDLADRQADIGMPTALHDIDAGIACRHLRVRWQGTGTLDEHEATEQRSRQPHCLIRM